MTRDPSEAEFGGALARFVSRLGGPRRPVLWIIEDAEWLDSAKVFDVILAVPKYGRVKVNRVLKQCRISPSKTIGGLSERQRAELVALLRR